MWKIITKILTFFVRNYVWTGDFFEEITGC